MPMLSYPRPSAPFVSSSADAHASSQSAGAAGTPALEMNAVCHAFGAVPALRDITFSLEGGQSLVLVGPSGCGKSTLLRLAAGLETLAQGEIRIKGRTVAARGHHVPPERRNVGLVFQDFALFPHLDVNENIGFGLKGRPRAEREARIAELVSRVRMQAHARAFPHALSGGQQQRVALARALAPMPDILLLDEPFSGLDTVLRREVRMETRELLRRSGCASILVTHEPEEALLMADVIVVLDKGRIEQVGTPGVIYGAPASPFVAGFFGPITRVPGTFRGGRVVSPLGSLPARTGAAASEGDVEIVFRPEALTLGRIDAPPRSAETSSCVFEAEVLRVWFGGSHVLVELNHPHPTCGRIEARVPSKEFTRLGISVGRHVLCSLDADDVFLFPPA